jgi:hypothetical protein
LQSHARRTGDRQRAKEKSVEIEFKLPCQSLHGLARHGLLLIGVCGNHGMRAEKVNQARNTTCKSINMRYGVGRENIFDIPTRDP